MTLVQMDSRKWPDHRHWQYKMKRLGEDEHGVWLFASGDTVARRGTEPPRPLRRGFLSLVPHRGWWIAEFYREHPRRTVYVNIGTEPVWEGDRVTQVDLDLDVVRNLDGTVAVIDEDEFLQHQVSRQYPAWLIAGARTAADRAVADLEQRTEPFDVAAEPWLDLGFGR